MQINSSGNVGIGVTNPNSPLTVGGNTATYTTHVGILWNSSSEQAIVMQTSSGTFSGNPVLFLNSGGGLSGYISQSTSAVGYNTSSDRRIKENIKLPERGLDVLTTIPVRDFNFITTQRKSAYKASSRRSFTRFIPRQ